MHVSCSFKRLLLVAITVVSIAWGDASAPPINLHHLLAPRTAVDLAGSWDACSINSLEERPAVDTHWQSVPVPGNHTSLYRNARQGRAWFRTRFEIREDTLPPLRRTLLHAELIADDCEIVVNGRLIASRQCDWEPFAVDISEAIHSGTNELLIGALYPAIAGIGQERPGGWTWYAPQWAGIPLPIWLEHVSPVAIEDVFVQPQAQGGTRLVTSVTVCNRSAQTVTVSVGGSVVNGIVCRPEELTLAAGSSAQVTLSDRWENPTLWWPESPHLYDLDVTLSVDGVVMDAYRQSFGFRDLKVVGPRLLLNGKPVIQRRESLIIYPTSMSEASLETTFRRLQARGYNGVRLHGGAPPRVLNVADRLGMLVTLESKVNEPRGDTVSEAYWPRAEAHLQRMVETARNHPSVIFWAVCNEFGSAYMKGDDEHKQRVDTWLAKMCRKLELMDPTRPVTCSGEIELGGVGHHGPAPNLSLHYAWQQTKARSQLPATRYWLEEGGVPWQGVAWDRTKPVLLCEDLYPAYCWNPPWGMTQWAGESAFAADGYYRAWFDAARMLAEGYYHTGVTCWNPWATNAAKPNAPLFEYGQLMPDYLLATREYNRTFVSGQVVTRTLHVHNVTFQDEEVSLTSELRLGKDVISTESRSFTLKGGGMQTGQYALSMPDVASPAHLTWRLVLSNERSILSERLYDYTVFPKTTVTDRIAAVCGDADSAAALRLVCPAVNIFGSLDDALASQPQRLILARVKLSDAALAKLDEAVRAGLNAQLLESPDQGALPPPLRLSKQATCSYAFVRSPHDARLAGWEDVNLKWWGEDLVVSRHPVAKPAIGRFRILLDAGTPEGLTVAPLLELYRGRGSYLVCQLDLLGKAEAEPAARWCLAQLFQMPPRVKAPAYPIYLMASADSPIPSRLRQLGIPFTDATSLRPTARALLVVDGRELTATATERVAAHLQAGGKVWLQSLNDAGAEALRPLLGGEALALPLSKTGNLILRDRPALFDGISNDDLCWPGFGESQWPASGKKPSPDNPPMLASSLGLPSSHDLQALTEPAGVASGVVAGGDMVVCQIRWDDAGDTAGDKAARIALALLCNFGADLGQGALPRTSFAPIDISMVANRRWATSDEENDGARTAWFGESGDDMPYFPVNGTGMDPFLHVPQPVESFPPQPVVMGGIPFFLQDPQEVASPTCIILQGDAVPRPNVSLRLEANTQRIWCLGALEKVVSKPSTPAQAIWHYRDGHTQAVMISACRDVNGYAWRAEASGARLGWLGPSRRHDESVLWVWSIDNPEPTSLVTRVSLELTGDIGLAIVAATAEQ